MFLCAFSKAGIVEIIARNLGKAPSDVARTASIKSTAVSKTLQKAPYVSAGFNILYNPLTIIQHRTSRLVDSFDADKIYSKCGAAPPPQPLTPTLIKGSQRFRVRSAYAFAEPALAEPARPETQAATGGSLAGIRHRLIDVGLVASPRLPSSLSRQLLTFKVSQPKHLQNETRHLNLGCSKKTGTRPGAGLFFKTAILCFCSVFLLRGRFCRS